MKKLRINLPLSEFEGRAIGMGESYIKREKGFRT